MSTVQNWRPQAGRNVVAIVVDIRSSSRILNDLAARDASFGRYIEVVEHMGRVIAPYTQRERCNAYKFTGDGWIVIFDEDTEGTVLLGFMSKLSSCYASHSGQLSEPLKEQRPRPRKGLTFGLDNGSVAPLLGSREYIGRTIVIACRLQTEARKSTDDYVAYISGTCFRDCRFGSIPTLQSRDERVCFDGHEEPCKSIGVPLA